MANPITIFRQGSVGISRHTIRTTTRQTKVWQVAVSVPVNSQVVQNPGAFGSVSLGLQFSAPDGPDAELAPEAALAADAALAPDAPLAPEAALAAEAGEAALAGDEPLDEDAPLDACAALSWVSDGAA